jgi:phospholipid/cholesterol/gamma-HCH transport system substrate-binding protein
MAMSHRRTGQRNPPYKTAGLIVCVAAAVALAFIWFQFRGELTAKDQLVLISARAGLSMDPGAKVTYNGVQIGRVGKVDEISVGGVPRAKIILDVDPTYMKLIPKNVDATVQRHHGFRQQVRFLHVTEKPCQGPDYRVRRDRPDQGDHRVQHDLRDGAVGVRAGGPDQLNQTLAATAEALDGLGDRFGESIVQGDEILADINPQMRQVRRNNQALAELGALYANASDGHLYRQSDLGPTKPKGWQT